MKFENGRHLENYILKILSNNTTTLNDDEISHIRNHYLALNFNRDKFIKSVSKNRNGTILRNDFMEKIQEFQKNGYIVFDCKQNDDNTYGCVLHQI